MEQVTIAATGSYAYEMKPELVESLRDSIEQHMKAYGLKEIAVQSRVLSGDDATATQACQPESGGKHAS